jgi:hypothetical protein
MPSSLIFAATLFITTISSGFALKGAIGSLVFVLHQFQTTQQACVPPVADARMFFFNSSILESRYFPWQLHFQ